VVLVDGTVRQSGSPQEVFERPADASVAAVVGVETAVPGLVAVVEHGLAQVVVGEQVLHAVAPDGLAPGGSVLVCIRAEDVALEPAEAAGGGSPRNRLGATVTAIADEGPLLRVDLDAGFRLASYVTRPAAEDLGLRPGRRVQAVVKSPAVHLVERVAP
jgi:molybdate transport system ATP-binding protein